MAKRFARRLGSGPCPATAAVKVTKTVCPGAAQGASGIFSPAYQTNAQGAAWSSAGLTDVQSVTVTAIKAQGVPSGPNVVLVTLGGGGALGGTFFRTGLRLTEEYPSYTWSVAQDAGDTAESLGQLIEVTATGDSAFAVVWTAACLVALDPT